MARVTRVTKNVSVKFNFYFGWREECEDTLFFRHEDDILNHG